MRQVWISRAGRPEVLRIDEAPDPVPRSGEVRLRVQAVGVCFADIMGRMGLERAAPAIPYVPGFEVAGKIDMVGPGVTDLKEGEDVLGVTLFGGYTDTLCIPHRQVMRRWEWMSAEDAASLPVDYLMAYVALVVMGSLRPGDKVLIHNAGGGVGVAALDLCKMLGAETFGTSSPQKHVFLKARGLDHALGNRPQDYVSAIRELTAGKGVQVILDPLGGSHWARNYSLLTPTGRLVCYGNSSAAPGKKRSLTQVFRLLLSAKGYTPLKLMRDSRGIMGVSVVSLWDDKDRLRQMLHQILTWYDEALFRPHIDRTFPLSEAAAAHHYLQDRRNLGKVLLIP